MSPTALPTHVALRLAEHEHALRTEDRHHAVHAADHRAQRHRRRRRPGPLVRQLLPLVLALVALLGGVVPTSPAEAAAGEWQDGRSDSDTIIDRITGSPGTGVSAQTGWRTDSGQVPRVGEAFYVRGYIGLVSQPWSGHVAVLPEVLLPSGVEYADDVKPVRWALGSIDDPQQFSTAELTYDRGQNGGLLVGTPDGRPWTLEQGDVLEVQVPVRALRTLKGPATQRPECQSRTEGTAPCPVDESGDHLQVAFTVGGHGGDKQYVTPYVGLFAQAVSGGGTGSGSGSGSGSASGYGTGGAAAVAAPSTTTASYSVKRGKAKAIVTVTTSAAPSGTVVVTDKGRTVGSATVSGRTVTLKLAKLKRGKHVLVATFSGSPQAAASSSTPVKVRVR